MASPKSPKGSKNILIIIAVLSLLTVGAAYSFLKYQASKKEGFAQGFKSPRVAGYILKEGAEFGAGDIKSMVAEPSVCKAECDKMSECVGFVVSKNKDCWFKNKTAFFNSDGTPKTSQKWEERNTYMKQSFNQERKSKK